METLNDVQERSKKIYFLLKCPHCGEEVVVEWKELFDNKVLFEPKEFEYECWVGGFGDEFKQTRKELRSTNTDKDVYHLTCCNCGKEWDEPAKDIPEKKCNADGTKRKMFVLSEIETAAAYDFIKRHNHRKDFEREDKMAFSSLGHQFTFSITPGGFGPLVVVKCNHCGEVEDITDSDNW